MNGFGLVLVLSFAACCISVASAADEVQMKEESSWLSWLASIDINPLPGQRTDIGSGLGLSIIALVMWVGVVIVLLQSTASENRRSEFTKEIEYYPIPDPETFLNGKQPISRIGETPTRQQSSLQSTLITGVDRLSKALSSLPALPSLPELPATSKMSDTFSMMSEAVSGGIDRVATDSNLQDCVLQTVCYLSAPTSNSIGRRFVNENRRPWDWAENNAAIPTTRSQRRQQSSRSDKDDISSKDCEVFGCSAVTFGHSVFKLYRTASAVYNSVNLE